MNTGTISLHVINKIDILTFLNLNIELLCLLHLNQSFYESSILNQLWKCMWGKKCMQNIKKSTYLKRTNILKLKSKGQF